LQRLGRAVEQVGRGNLDVKVEVKSSDAIGQLAATFNGMTEHIRRLIESQREMTRAVSHELRTPVARLRFGMEILADTPDENVRHQKLDELDRDIDQLNELIDEILTFARLEEGSPAIEFEDIDVVALLERLQSELIPISQDIAIELDPQVLADLAPEDAIAEGSERYIHRIVQNLVTNALRYAKSRVVLRYRSDGELACIEVEDDGPGIPEADRERIFLPFSRLDDSRQRPGRGGGYGLGLSIVQRIADWHGGTVAILDGAEGGALFRVCWPHQRPVSGHVLGRL
jgi:two-component system sensor histidine kinase RstB